MTQSAGAGGAWVRRFHPSPEAKVRLVCFPHAGGSASFYFPVSNALKPAVEVLALQYPGRQDRRSEELIKDIPTMADRTFEALRPWVDERTVFFGHSMGAVLAFEVARRMADKDGTAPARLIASGRRAPSCWRDERVHTRDDDGLIEELKSLAGTEASLFGDEEILRMILPAIRSDYTAIETYTYSPGPSLTCPVTMFTGDDDPQVTLDEARDWEKHTTGGFDLHVFSGGHFYLTARAAEVITKLTGVLRSMGEGPSLLAISDVHVGHKDNREIVEALRPGHDGDWLIVAGDVAEFAGDIEWALSVLSERFAKVIWAPGNHELWTPPRDPVQLRGQERYLHLVDFCRRLGVSTPEDPYPIWEGEGGPVAIAPLFVLYDYTFLPSGFRTKEDALAHAYEVGVVCTDELLLHPDPYPSREAWSRARVAETERRLAELPEDLPTILVNHFPLVREPTRVLYRPEFSLWCGTESTATWHLRYRAEAVVYGHLHIPRTLWIDGVRHVEVSVGYPREWRRRSTTPGLRRILPAETETK